MDQIGTLGTVPPHPEGTIIWTTAGIFQLLGGRWQKLPEPVVTDRQRLVRWLIAKLQRWA